MPAVSAHDNQDTILAFFRAAGGPDPELPWPSPQDIARLADGAIVRRLAPARADDLAVLHARRTAG